jgi:hypothetical protein
VRSDDEDETYVKGLEMTTEGEQAVLMVRGAQRPNNAITMYTDMGIRSDLQISAHHALSLGLAGGSIKTSTVYATRSHRRQSSPCPQ